MVRPMFVKIGACPRCGGALALQEDIYGRYWDCLSCGHHIEVAVGSVGREDHLTIHDRQDGLKRGKKRYRRR